MASISSFLILPQTSGYNDLSPPSPWSAPTAREIGFDAPSLAEERELQDLLEDPLPAHGVGFAGTPIGLAATVTDAAQSHGLQASGKVPSVCALLFCS
jgi:hypothetical protein